MSANYDLLDLMPSVSNTSANFEEMEWPDVSNRNLFSVQHLPSRSSSATTPAPALPLVQNGWMQYQPQGNTANSFQRNYINKNQQFDIPVEPIHYQNNGWQRVPVRGNYYTSPSHLNGAHNMVHPQFHPTNLGLVPSALPVHVPMPQNLMNQVPMYQPRHQQLQPSLVQHQQPMLSPYPSSQYQAKPNTSHHEAQISLVPKPSGGLQGVVKRKRKRTMFTTEQVNYLEEAYQRMPYVTKESRQSISKELNVSDSAIKIWFQNRRIRGKKEQEEQQDKCHESDCCTECESHFVKLEPAPTPKEHAPITTKDFYNNYMSSILDTPSNTSESEETSSPLNQRVDELEAELMTKADHLGYISLTDKVVKEIVDLIDEVLPDDFEFDFTKTAPLSDGKHKTMEIDTQVTQEDFRNLEIIDLTNVESNGSSNSMEKEEDLLDKQMNDPIAFQYEVVIGSNDSVSSTAYAGSIYEPVSPLPEELRVDDPKAWNPSKEIREKLYNVHFC